MSQITIGILLALALFAVPCFGVALLVAWVNKVCPALPEVDCDDPFV